MPTIISKAVGIDLGTTNSAVALMNPGDTEIIIHTDPNSKRQTTPSCVWKNPKTGEIVVGHNALSYIGAHPSPIRSIKRKMGHTVKVHLTDQDMAPEEVSALILKEMKRQIEEDTAGLSTPGIQWMVDRAIITVPAYFDQPAIDATRKAGEMAGLKTLELLAEPTAAACYHCWLTKTQNGIFLVYDFGGGTFDVTVLRSKAGMFDVLGISGNMLLGGDDLDTALAQHLQKRLMKDYALDLDTSNNPEDQLRFDLLKWMAEGVKKTLSTADKIVLRDSVTLRDKNNKPVIIDTPFDRSDIEAVMRPIVERTIPYCFDALEKAHAKAGITLADVDMVILAGGSTHIPLVQQMVRQNLCTLEDSEPTPLLADSRADQPRSKSVKPLYKDVDTLVALGAAIRAAAQGGLEIYDPERAVRVSFRGTGVTGAEETSIGGVVESVNPGVDLTNGRIVLKVASMDYDDDQALDENGSFGFKEIPLQAGADNVLTFEVYDGKGQLAASVERQVTQSRDAARPTGGERGLGVLSKAILLGVQGVGGDAYLKELFPAMTRLPIDKPFHFSHPGGVETVLLPLFQLKRKIQEIQVPVPLSMPKGTPVLLDVHIDKLSFITVKGQVGDVTFDAPVEVPPDRKLPGAEECAALEKSFREAANYLPAGKKALAEVRFRKAKASFDAAAKQRDEAQAVHDFEEMEEVVADISKTGGTLEPPREFFDKLVTDCLEINRYVANAAVEAGGQPHDMKETAKTIETQRQQGEKAIQARDQKAYSDVIVMLENQKDYLIQLYRKTAKPVDTRSETEKAMDYVRSADAEADKIGHLARAKNRPDLAAEAQQIKRNLAELEGDIQRNPQGVHEKVVQLNQHLEKINNILKSRTGQGAPGQGGYVVDDGKDKK